MSVSRKRRFCECVSGAVACPVQEDEEEGRGSSPRETVELISVSEALAAAPDLRGETLQSAWV